MYAPRLGQATPVVTPLAERARVGRRDGSISRRQVSPTRKENHESNKKKGELAKPLQPLRDGRVVVAAARRQVGDGDAALAPAR